MLRTAFRQLSTIRELTPSLFSRTTALISKPATSFHTSSTIATSSRINRDRDSVRQKGVEVNPSSSTDTQNFSYNRQQGGIAFPTQETLNGIFDGVPYSQIPIIHIKSTSNNTIISVTDGDGVVQAIQSAGTVGFRNARKGTNVAAQAAAIALADDARRKDIKQVRVCLRGIGPGRFPALKAIEISGIKVVSITDTTPLPHNGNRPKKVRRL